MQKSVQNELGLLERLTAPTPKLFQYIRLAGIILATLGATLLGLQQQGIPIPAVLTSLIGKGSAILGAITGTAGAVAIAIAQITVDFDALKKKQELDNI